MARNLAICPGTPRRLRAQNRRLCTCGPGVTNPCGPCPACFCLGRALAGDPRDSCGGLFAPFYGLGKSIHVNASWTVITAQDMRTFFPGLGYTNYRIGNGIYTGFAAFDVCQRTTPNSTGHYLEVLNMEGVVSVTGAASPVSSNPVTNIPSVVFFAPASRALIEEDAYVFMSDVYSGVSCSPSPPYTNGRDACALAYPRPYHMLKIAEVLLHLPPFGNVYDLWFNGWPYGAHPNGPSILGSPAPFNASTSGIFPQPWYELGCAGSHSDMYTTNHTATEQWDSTVTGNDGRLHVNFREDWDDQPFGLTGHFFTDWRFDIHVSPLEPCGTDTANPNASAIEAHMLKGRPCAGCG